MAFNMEREDLPYKFARIEMKNEDFTAEFLVPDPKEVKINEARRLLKVAKGSELIIVSDKVKREALADALDAILDIVSMQPDRNLSAWEG